MGFAVVAEEVRNLSQRCTQAARDASALIEEFSHVAAAVLSVTGAPRRKGSGETMCGWEARNRRASINQIAKAIAQMGLVSQAAHLHRIVVGHCLKSI